MAALTIRQTTLVQNLEQYIEHIGMSLFNLVKKENGVRTTTHRFSKFAAFVVSHISWRRAHELSHGMALHIFRHIKGYERILATEEKLRQRFCKLRLANARWPQEDERTAGTARILERTAGTPDCLGNLCHGFFLTNNALVQDIFRAQQARSFGFSQARHRNACDAGDYFGYIIFINGYDMLIKLRTPILLKFVTLSEKFFFFIAELRCAFKFLNGSGFCLVFAHALKIGVYLSNFRRQRHLVNAGAGASLIQDINSFIRQETILNVAMGKHDRRIDSGFGIAHMVMLLITILQTVDDTDGVVRTRLTDVHRLETALEGRVLLDMLAIFFRCSCAYDLNLSARKRRLQN